MLILAVIFFLAVSGKFGWMQFLGYSYDYDYGSAIGGMNFTVFLAMGVAGSAMIMYFIDEYEKNK
jgi:hypothetical protein